MHHGVYTQGFSLRVLNQFLGFRTCFQVLNLQLGFFYHIDVPRRMLVLIIYASCHCILRSYFILGFLHMCFPSIILRVSTQVFSLRVFSYTMHIGVYNQGLTLGVFELDVAQTIMPTKQAKVRGNNNKFGQIQLSPQASSQLVQEFILSQQE